MWDYIFSGSVKAGAKIPSENFQPLDQDPFANLEFLALAMIAQLKTDLLEADFSACLGLLMSYKEPAEQRSLLEKAENIR